MRNHVKIPSVPATTARRKRPPGPPATRCDRSIPILYQPRELFAPSPWRTHPRKHQCAKRGLARIFAAFAKFRACTLFALSHQPGRFRSDRCPPRGQGNTRVDACRLQLLLRLNRIPPVTIRQIVHRIVRRNLEQRRHRLTAIDVGQFISHRSRTRIAARAHHRHLQLRRIPALGNRHDREFIADQTGGNCNRGARARGRNAFDHLRAEILHYRLGLR